MNFDAALVETELEDACRALGLSASDTAWVMTNHRASTGALLCGCRKIDSGVESYVRCWLVVRDHLAGRA